MKCVLYCHILRYSSELFLLLLHDLLRLIDVHIPRVQILFYFLLCLPARTTLDEWYNLLHWFYKGMITEIFSQNRTTSMKKAECQRIDAFELWCWRRLLRVPWTARRSKQSILKEINLESSLEGLRLKLKLQYFGYLIQRADSLEKTWYWEKLTGGEGGIREWDNWTASPT